jgi:hypothetical protein
MKINELNKIVLEEDEKWQVFAVSFVMQILVMIAILFLHIAEIFKWDHFFSQLISSFGIVVIFEINLKIFKYIKHFKAKRLVLKESGKNKELTLKELDKTSAM